MVLDAGRRIEDQTRKLFTVCRSSDVPIISFVNKLDREGGDPSINVDYIEIIVFACYVCGTSRLTKAVSWSLVPT
jgi:peptide chain release factor 3